MGWRNCFENVFPWAKPEVPFMAHRGRKQIPLRTFFHL